MRIAQVAPLAERIPPPRYGAIEQLISCLADELVARGHEVTLFAAGDSRTKARLHSVYPRGLNESPEVREPELYRAILHDAVRRRAGQFDVIHAHQHTYLGCLAIANLQGLATPVIHSLHSPFTQDSRPFFTTFAAERFVAITEAQRGSGPALNYIGTVRHGLQVADFPFGEATATPPYVAFLGRLRPEKGPEIAIAAAQRAGYAIKLAGPVRAADRRFFDEKVAPHVDGERVEFCGELDFVAKTKLLAGATAMLFPITAIEPFGLVMVESMLCGTPVVASSVGSVHEVIVRGETGFLCDSVDEMAAAIVAAASLSRSGCRAYAAEHFNHRRMTDDYERLYRDVVANP